MDLMHPVGTARGLRPVVVVAAALLLGGVVLVAMARSTVFAKAAGPQVQYQTAEIQYQSQYPAVGY